MNTIKITITIEVQQGSLRAMCFSRIKTGRTIAELVSDAVHEVFPAFRHRRSGDIVRTAAEVMPPDEFASERAVAVLDGISLEQSLRRLVCQKTPIKVLPKP